MYIVRSDIIVTFCYRLSLFTQVFRDQDLPMPPGRERQKVAESILRYFPGFDAFTLPPPSADDEVMRSLNENKALLQSKFLSGLEQFKSLLRSTLVPKHSCTDGEFVTGEGEDFLTELLYYFTCEKIDFLKSRWVVPRQQCTRRSATARSVFVSLLQALLSERQARWFVLVPTPEAY